MIRCFMFAIYTMHIQIFFLDNLTHKLQVLADLSMPVAEDGEVENVES